jgi:hypothetical protein
VHLGELSAERSGAIWTRHLRKVTERCRNSVTRLIDDTGALIRRKCPDHTSTISSAPWKKPLKAPTSTSDAGRHHRRKKRRCARNRDDADACGDRRSNKLLPRITDERGTRITDKRNRLTLEESRNDRGNPVSLVKPRE